jgi:hypothetical protein
MRRPTISFSASRRSCAPSNQSTRLNIAHKKSTMLRQELGYRSNDGYVEVKLTKNVGHRRGPGLALVTEPAVSMVQIIGACGDVPS